MKGMWAWVLREYSQDKWLYRGYGCRCGEVSVGDVVWEYEQEEDRHRFEGGLWDRHSHAIDKAESNGELDGACSLIDSAKRG